MSIGNSGGKYTFLDEEHIPKSASGLYCFTPFDNEDKNKKIVFKVGRTSKIHNRLEHYYTSFMSGIYLIEFLQYKTGTVVKSGNLKYLTNKSRLSCSENDLFEKLQKNGCRRLRTTLRVVRCNEEGGESEWFYGTENSIHKVFNEMYEMYGGIPHYWSYKKRQQVKFGSKFEGKTVIPLTFV
jgi:hypothetical protein